MAVVALGAGWLGPVAGTSPSWAEPVAEPADGLVVRFAPGVDAEEAAAAVAESGGRLGAEVAGTGFHLVAVEPGRLAGVHRSLAKSETVTDSEPNRVRRAFAVPTDSLYPQQAGYLQAIHMQEAWDLETGDPDLIIAVLDSGVESGHPDLDGRLIPGADVVNGLENVIPFDDYGHGTAVAGVIAAETNNGSGVAGAAWEGRIMPVKVINRDGEARDADIAFGIEWAVRHGADVINLSLGGPGASTLLQEAIDFAVSNGVVVVAAAGNANETVPNWPAAARNVIAVGATDSAGNRASFSNYGYWLDLSAPGVEIVTTDVCRGALRTTIVRCTPSTLSLRAPYAAFSGTSFSAPLVSGAALLLRAAYPTATPADIADRLRRSARDLGASGFDPTYGAGLVDAAAALRIGGFSAATGAPGAGYWMLGNDAAVYPFGAAPYAGEPLGNSLAAADIEPAPDGHGYWIVTDTGAVFAQGLPYYGGVSSDQLDPGEKVTSLSATATGDGYWIFTTLGRVFPFGSAADLGDVSHITLNRPVVDSIPAPGGQGYYMVADDGGVFAVGPGAVYRGSLPEVLGGRLPNRPVRSLVPDPDGSGYWLVAEDGGVFAFDAPYRGSLPAVLDGRLPNAPVRGMVPYGNAYLMVATDGGIFNFATDLAFAGSLGADPPDAPVVAVAALPR